MGSILNEESPDKVQLAQGQALVEFVLMLVLAVSLVIIDQWRVSKNGDQRVGLLF